MEKYTKHFIEIAFTKLEFDDFFFEEHQIEARDSEFLNKYFFDEELIKSLIEGEYYSKRYVVKYPTFITSGRPLAKIRFYDINYIVDDDLVYESEKHNYSNWICFGIRTSFKNELLDGKDVCFNGAGEFIMDEEDITYDEFVQNYLKESQNLNKVKKL